MTETLQETFHGDDTTFATSVKEIYSFLDDDKKDVRIMAAQLILGLSSDDADAIFKIFASNPSLYISSLLRKLSDSPDISCIFWDSLINFSASDENFCLFVIDNHFDEIYQALCSKTLFFAEAATKILSNLSKHAGKRSEVFKAVLENIFTLYINGRRHNPHCSYDYLASVLADLSFASKECRIFLLGNGQKNLSTLLLDIRSPSVIRRGGAISCIKNSLFEVDFHEEILEKEKNDDFLITSLTGLLLDSKSVLDKEERDELPVELFLLDSCRAEQDMVLRSMILEILIVLSTTRTGRDVIRKKNIYPILREWHKLEADADLKELCEKVVELLIRDEE